MAPKQLLVKRHGHLEEFDEKKIYGSVYAAALNAHMHEVQAEKLADKVMKSVVGKVRKKDSVGSEDIRDMILQELGGTENDVGFLYLNHLDIN